MKCFSTTCKVTEVHQRHAVFLSQECASTHPLLVAEPSKWEPRMSSPLCQENRNTSILHTADKIGHANPKEFTYGNLSLQLSREIDV
jgi:hypothetical protein